MFEQVQKRAVQCAEREADARRRALGARLEAQGFAVVEEGEALIVSAPGIARRWVLDAQLRWRMMEDRNG